MAGTSNQTISCNSKLFTLKSYNDGDRNFIDNETQKFLLAKKDIMIDSLKDKCDKLESKIRQLLSENESLSRCKASLIQDIAELNESKIKLRKKNSQINEELQIKNKETYEAMENISVISKDHANIESQYFKLQLENKKLKEELDCVGETNNKLLNRVEWLSNQLQYEVKTREEIENKLQLKKGKVLVESEVQCNLTKEICSSRTYKVDKTSKHSFEDNDAKELHASFNLNDILDWGNNGCDISSVKILKDYFPSLMKHIEVQNKTLSNCVDRLKKSQPLIGLTMKEASTNVNMDSAENVCPICLSGFDLNSELEEHVFDHFHNDPVFDMEVERRIQEIL